MKKILIPTDFSANSYLAIEHIVNLFKNEHCDFYLLNSYNYNINSLNALEIIQAGDEWFDAPKDESQEQLEKMAATFTSSTEQNHKFHTVSECSDSVEAIKKNVDLLNIDMIVLSNSTKKIQIKTLNRILGKIWSCPILLIPPNSLISKKVVLSNL